MGCKIIAEIGWNHMGDLSLAEHMVMSAINCGADFIKFQTWSVENLKPGSWDNDGRREIYEKAELKPRDYEWLLDCVTTNGVKFLTSVFNPADFARLPSKYRDFIKIPSSEVANIELLEKAQDLFDHVIISTGASLFDEVVVAHEVCRGKCTLMHCVSSYPCPPESANLRRIDLLKQICHSVGYSDHTSGISAPAYAMSNDCAFIEKHFTTDNNLPGRDNKFAADPECLKSICEMRDELDQMTKTHSTDFQECEQDVRDSYRGRWG